MYKLREKSCDENTKLKMKILLLMYFLCLNVQWILATIDFKWMSLRCWWKDANALPNTNQIQIFMGISYTFRKATTIQENVDCMNFLTTLLIQIPTCDVLILCQAFQTPGTSCLEQNQISNSIHHLKGVDRLKNVWW